MRKAQEFLGSMKQLFEFDTWTDSPLLHAVRIAASRVLLATYTLGPAMSATRKSFIKASDEMSPAATTFRVVGD